MASLSALGITAVLVATMVTLVGGSGGVVSERNMAAIYEGIFEYEQKASDNVIADTQIINGLMYLMYPNPSELDQQLGVDQEPAEAIFKKQWAHCPALMFVVCGKLFGKGDVCNNLVEQYNMFLSGWIKKNVNFSEDVPTKNFDKQDMSGEEVRILQDLQHDLNEKENTYLRMILRFSEQNSTADLFRLTSLNKYNIDLSDILAEVNLGYCPVNIFVACGAKSKQKPVPNCGELAEHYHRLLEVLRVDASVGSRSGSRS
eukprot:Lankesteria_metandrocarpae@DN9735_c0_g1_i1.p1